MFSEGNNGSASQERRRRVFSVGSLNEMMHNRSSPGPLRDETLPLAPGRATPYPFGMKDLDPMSPSKITEPSFSLRNCLTKEPL